ncbi:MAG: basic secretory family protein [Planctomycetia bacterium]|nr:basic secretory family protein [Planctomycetia bacterium]
MNSSLRPLTFVISSLLAAGLVASAGLAQPPANDAPAAAAKAFTLVISGEIDAALAPTVGRLTTLFYESYPQLVARFENPQKPAPRRIRLVFERGLKVPAHCSGDQVTVSVDWMRRHPEDLGLLTHELTHAVQAYPSPEPGWFTEGLADYARHKYGPKEQPGWSLPEKLTAQQSYKDSYRTTARFLVWLDGKHPGLVDKLHRKMQNRDFATEDFRTLTGTTLDALWEECVREK